MPFIVGTRRSGTTLLRLMLDAHPDLAIPPQTHFIPLVAERCKTASDPRSAFLETLATHPRWPNFHLDRHVLDDRVAAIDPFDVGEALRAFYRTYAERFGKWRWGDKTPGYMGRMALIEDLMPEACFVHIIRDGRAVAVSLNEAWRPSGREKTAEEAAAWWMAKIVRARRQAGRLRSYVEIRYEELVLRSEPTLKSICDAIALAWDPAMLEYHTTARKRMAEVVVTTKAATVEEQLSRHLWTGSPPERSRIDRWKSEMSRSDRRDFERIAGDLLVELGYEI